MRLIHTSDWHLGQTVRDISRDEEHARFLHWLVLQCKEQYADVLLITGDIFDSSVPKSSAETLWYSFLARVKEACPSMRVVAISGNHDSPGRLAASAPLLAQMGVFVVTKPDASCVLEWDDAIIAAIPFVRAVDLPVNGDVPVETAKKIGALCELAKSKQRQGQVLVAMSHAHIVGADVDWISERRANYANVGHQEAMSHRLFDEAFDYVALGHIHKPQRVGRDTIRYAGAPLAFAADERHYAHCIAVVDVTKQGTRIQQIKIPVSRQMLRIPSRGAAALDAVLAEVATLPTVYSQSAHDAHTELVPFLELHVALPQPEPRLLERVSEAAAAKNVALVRVAVTHAGNKAPFADSSTTYSQGLVHFSPEEVLTRRWRSLHDADPSVDIMNVFQQALAESRGVDT